MRRLVCGRPTFTAFLHASITELGSIARAFPAPVRRAATRSIIPSRRYLSDGAAPCTRNGTTATSPASIEIFDLGHHLYAAAPTTSTPPSATSTIVRDARSEVRRCVGPASAGDGGDVENDDGGAEDEDVDPDGVETCDVSPLVYRSLGPASASANSAALRYRSPGTFASARMTLRSSQSGRVARMERMGGGVSTMCRAMSCCAFAATNGGVPASIS
jgi:hypothetical protein